VLYTPNVSRNHVATLDCSWLRLWIDEMSPYMVASHLWELIGVVALMNNVSSPRRNTVTIGLSTIEFIGFSVASLCNWAMSWTLEFVLSIVEEATELGKVQFTKNCIRKVLATKIRHLNTLFLRWAYPCSCVDTQFH